MTMREISLTDQRVGIAALDEERRAIGMSLRVFADAAGVSISAFYEWRSGAKSPALRNVVAMADALGFEVVLRRKVAAMDSLETEEPTQSSRVNY